MPEKKLNARQRLAARLVAHGEQYTNVAAQIGVAERTLIVWRKLDAFQDEVQRQQDELTATAARRLTAGLDDMLDVLERIAHDEDNTPGVRVRAALGWLDRHLRLVDIADIQARLSQLERTR